jgi:NAD-dependent dihydropyrimidine dehydrogenase PreA subunit
MRYIANVVTLELDAGKCTGCGICALVCPHGVFAVEGGKARIVDRDLCIECGACRLNCPADAVAVRSGVGCAAGILRGRLGLKGNCCSGPSGPGGAPCCSEESCSSGPDDAGLAKPCCPPGDDRGCDCDESEKPCGG